MKSAHISFQNFLEKEFEDRKRKNSSYSLRAFAKYLEMPAPKLSMVLRKKAGISVLRAEKIAVKLKLDPKEVETFLNLVASKHARSRTERQLAQKALTSNSDHLYQVMNQEFFKIFSDWYFFAILEAIELINFKASVSWLSKRFTLSKSNVNKALKLLKKHAFIKEVNNTFVESEKNVFIPGGTPSRYIKSHHRQILQKAEEAIFECPLEEREFSSQIFSFNSDLMDEIRIELIKSRKKIIEKYESLSRGNKDRVYCFSQQFFPLDKIK